MPNYCISVKKITKKASFKLLDIPKAFNHHVVDAYKWDRSFKVLHDTEQTPSTERNHDVYRYSM